MPLNVAVLIVWGHVAITEVQTSSVATQGDATVRRHGAVSVHYGHEFVSAVSSLAFGFGIDAGFTLSNGLFFEGRIVYFTGKSEEGQNGGLIYQGNRRTLLTNANAGYEFELVEDVRLRPYVLVGLAWTRSFARVAGKTQSSSDVFGTVGPGLSFIWEAGVPFFGVDICIPIQPANLVPGLAIAGGLIAGVSI